MNDASDDDIPLETAVSEPTVTVGRLLGRLRPEANPGEPTAELSGRANADSGTQSEHPKEPRWP